MSGPRTALVQGGSRGLGLGFVRRLLEDDDFDHVIATSRSPEDSVELRALRAEHGASLQLEALDLFDEKSIAAAAERISETRDELHLLVNCSGLLHEAGRVRPEKRLEAIDPEALRRVFETNAFGPLLVAKHFLPLLSHSERAVLANVSARVGSIGDNRLGGWYAYRASKAAQNMFTRTLSIELARRAPQAICIALHPGTVDTDLSRPFQRGVAPEKLFPVDRAARQLLEVIDGLTQEQSGEFLAWDGTSIPW